MTLSIALAIYNEEKNILHCLKSIYEWADEIVIVDGTSSDKSVELIKKFDTKKKIHLLIEENSLMFNVNKQKAINNCTKDWVLLLDADEVVSKELKNEIEYIVKKKPTDSKEITGYWIPRLNYFLGRPLRKGGQYPDRNIRLYKKGSARYDCKDVHEQININGKLDYLKNDLIHYPFDDFEHYFKKTLSYAIIEAERLYKEENLSPSLWNFINYFIIKPKVWFLMTYFRHKGFMDGFPGFVFSLFSSLRYWIIYIRIYEKKSWRMGDV